jgi:putative oxidoreductase
MAIKINTSVWAPRALAALRIMTGLLFLAHGVVKLFGFPPGAQSGQVELMSLMGIGGVIELVTGALIMLGVYVRPAAFLASGTMAVAYWMFHAPSSPFPVANGGVAAILYCFIFLYLAVAGGGAWQLKKS